MVYVVFLAFLVPCLWHVVWPQLGGYCGQWTRAIPGWFLVKTLRVPELPKSSLARRCVEATLLHGWAQNCSRGTQLCGFPRNCVALAHFQAFRTAITFSSELRFGCS